ncbi:ATP-dependent helicase, partial [Candidatus Parcubacteria bacterium]|nr:ATP-dependent helicase [Candidatus Parcubacteria bacterium]
GREMQEQHQYVLVDEHQDTNNAQNKVLELLCNFHSNPNIFVVGDEKQAIYRFQGASIENFRYFQKLYPSANLIVLEENYRSTQQILDAAHSVLAGPKPLVSQREKGGNIKLYGFSNPDTELYGVALDIKSKLDSGTKPEEITILYRDNRDALTLARILEKLAVPFGIESDQDILSDPDIKKLLLIFDSVAHFGEDERLISLLHIDFLGIDPLEAYQLINEAYQKRISISVLLKTKFPALYKMYSGWATLSHNISLPELFEKIIKESGLLAHMLAQPDVAEKLQKLNGVFDEIRSLVEAHKEYGLSDFLKYLEILKTHNLLIKRHIGTHVGRVRLMTAHRSKGQEFGFVYIINAYDGHWGNKRRPNLLPLPSSVYSLSGLNPGEDNQNDDERRLFYVALTRAKKEVVISYAKESLSKDEQLPSLFVGEIKPELINQFDVSDYEQSYQINISKIFEPAVKVNADLKDKEFIKELFNKNGLSVTALNNYLDCPWRYFYRNLIRIPEAKTKHQMYGTAMHNTLKEFFDAPERSKELLLQSFAHYLEREPLKEADLKECTEKGKKSLAGWFDTYSKVWPKSSLTEFAVNGILLTPDIRITGKIDKIELIDVNNVNVVDYKTSKPKTRGEIEGTTQSSNGDVKRQLVFYNLLLNKHENGKYKMQAGAIDFTEPDEKGKYHKELFHIQPQEVSDLEVLIKKVADEILSLSFWDKTCDEKDCEFCALRKLMK